MWFLLSDLVNYISLLFCVCLLFSQYIVMSICLRDGVSIQVPRSVCAFLSLCIRVRLALSVYKRSGGRPGNLKEWGEVTGWTRRGRTARAGMGL